MALFDSILPKEDVNKERKVKNVTEIYNTKVKK